jgi:hypothetical protein
MQVQVRMPSAARARARPGAPTCRGRRRWGSDVAQDVDLLTRDAVAPRHADQHAGAGDRSARVLAAGLLRLAGRCIRKRGAGRMAHRSDRDFPKLTRVPAAWHGVSCEPLLGPIIVGDCAAGLADHGRRKRPSFPTARHGRGPFATGSMRPQRHYVSSQAEWWIPWEGVGMPARRDRIQGVPPALAA